MLNFKSAEGLFKAEDNILLFIQDFIRNDVLDSIMKFITHLGDKGILWIGIAIIMLISNKYRKSGIKLSAALLIGLFITNLVIKNIVKRPRPFDVIEGLHTLIPPPSDWSFPSGHTTSSIAAGVILLMHTPKKFGIPAFIISILISVSRMYVGVHYPSDIIAGAVVGVFAAILADKLVNMIYDTDIRRRLK